MKHCYYPKTYFFIFLILLYYNTAVAQVGIGNTDPAESSLLDIRDNNANKGILIPRIDITDLTTQAPITTATIAESLLVYNSNISSGKGFYYWDTDDTEWKKLLSGNDIDNDWFEEGTTALPDDINDNIYTNGEVGIGTTMPSASLHISEPGLGTTASATDGTILIEHANNGGESSIVFKSKTNNNSDYAYINFSDDGSSNGTTTENALLTIGIENDVVGQYQDDINIAPSGELLVSLGNPSVTDYNFSDNALSPVTDNVRDLGDANSHWDDLFVNDEIRNADGGNIDITLTSQRDYRFNQDAFLPFGNRAKDLGINGNAWRNLYVTDIFSDDIVADDIFADVITANNYQASDRRLKENIDDLNLSTQIIDKINTYSYNYKADTNKLIHFGVMAQELQDILPNLVKVGDDNLKTLAVNYTELIPILINAIKEQQKIINSQGIKIDDLSSAVTEIRAMLPKDSYNQETSNNEAIITIIK